MKILLTGGSGFIGRNLLESPLAARHTIYAPSSRELNCMDEESVAACFRSHEFDLVIHSAVKPTHRNAKDLSNLFYSNLRMFCNLERYSHAYGRMLVIGSGAIYDNRHYRPRMSEESWRDHVPADDHGFCKYVCEKIIERSDNIVDLRVFGIFGKYEDYAIRFISNAICKVIFDMPITIRQDRRFDYLYVNDLMPVLEAFIEHNPRHQAYNITPGRSVLLSELAAMVLHVSGKNLPVLIAQLGLGLGLEYSGDNSRLREEFPDLRFTPLEQAVAELYKWYYDHREEINRDFLLTDK